MIDLHTHSSASDGTYTPSQLIKYASERGIEAIALTDHDTVSGLYEAASAASECDIIFVPGIEISAEYDCEVHIVGLCIDSKAERFIDKISQLIKTRDERNILLAEMMRADGFDISYEEVLAIAGDGVVGKPHFAAVLMNKGYVNSINEAFEKYFNKGKPYYLKRVRMSVEQAVEMIHSAGGIAVCAHLNQTKKNEEELRIMLTDMKKAGLDAIECYYTEYSEEFSQLCLGFASEFGFGISGGSDFHGKNKPAIDIGTGYGNLNIDLGVLKNLLK